MSDPSAAARALSSNARVHLVGVGGAGMSGLAQILVERGHQVSGSDLRGGRAATALAAMGAQIHVGHEAAHVESADAVVASNAIPDENPELVRAHELGLPVLGRAELLAALMAGYRRLLIAGTHGKTTTTAMTTVCLQAAALDPSFAIGGTLHDGTTNAHHGGEVFVAEADEAYGSFLALTPDCAVVTNVEYDHHDHYPDRRAVDDAFVAFLAKRPSDAPAILCADDEGAMRLADRVGGVVRTYGEHPEAWMRVVDCVHEPTESRFRLRREGVDLGDFRLRLPGRHNVLNATAAVAAASWAGADTEAVREGLARFTGAQRRFQRLGTASGVSVVDDYAHHPSELTATLAAARQAQPSGRVVAVFQPHRYSRTAALGSELGAALADADLAVVTDVYAAGEQPVPGVTGALVAGAAREGGTDVRYVGPGDDLAQTVADLVESGDLVLTLGAGDITELGPVLLRRLEGRRPDGPRREGPEG